MSLPFPALGPFKNLLKRFFSSEPWTQAHAAELSDLVAPAVDEGWWEHDLGAGIRLAHGITDGAYVLWVTGGEAPAPSIFDRVFTGPVVPEATPHPRKVKFTIGGEPAQGRWYRRHDPDPPDDDRVKVLLAQPDVTDVMVAGDFVTVGLDRTADWERRLDPLLALVTELFAGDAGRGAATSPPRTRDELVAEGRATPVAARPEELHLLDPDDPESRTLLQNALAGGDARLRRVAVAILAESTDAAIGLDALEAGAADRSRIVRRTAVDAAADTGAEMVRPLLERALADEDPWIRWKAVRALHDHGLGSSRDAVAALAGDDDFQVRFEVARALKA